MTHRTPLLVLLAIVLVVGSLATVVWPGRLGAQDLSCDAYLFQEDAQLALERTEATALDPEGDGIACDGLTRFTDAGLRLLVEPATAERATVVRVTDGDTIRVVLEATGQEWSARMIVTDAPEPNDCYGSQATRALGRLIEVGATVWLQGIARNVDGYDRLLRHVWYLAGDGTYRLAEHELTRRGYVFAHDYGDGSPYMPYVADAMRVASLSGLGLWSACDGLRAPADYADVTALAQGRATALSLTGSFPGFVPTTAPEQGPAAPTPTAVAAIDIGGGCEPAYPTICIPLGSPDLDCPEISARRFQVLPPDPHRFDGDHDGVGCESG